MNTRTDLFEPWRSPVPGWAAVLISLVMTPASICLFVTVQNRLQFFGGSVDFRNNATDHLTEPVKRPPQLPAIPVTPGNNVTNIEGDPINPAGQVPEEPDRMIQQFETCASEMDASCQR